MFFRVLSILIAALAASSLARITSVTVKGPVNRHARTIGVTFHTQNYITNNKEYSAVYGVTPANQTVPHGTAGRYLLPTATDLTNLPGTRANTTYSVPLRPQTLTPGNWSLLVSTLQTVGAGNGIFVGNHTAYFTVEE